MDTWNRPESVEGSLSINSNQYPANPPVNSADDKHCLVCLEKVQPVSGPNSVGNHDILELLCKTLDFPLIGPFIAERSWSVSNFQFCEGCAGVILESTRVLRQIKDLEDNLEQLRKQLKTSIRRCSNEDSGNDSEATVEKFVRNTFVQCWSSCTVEVDRISNNTVKQENNQENLKIKRRSRGRTKRLRIPGLPSSDAVVGFAEGNETGGNAWNFENDEVNAPDTTKTLEVSEEEPEVEDEDFLPEKEKREKKTLKRGRKRTGGNSGIVGPKKRKHSNKPLVCTQCGKGYRSQEYYDAHMMSHEGKLAFPCEHCEKKFALRHQLEVHARHVHNVVTKTRSSKSCLYCGLDFLQEFLSQDAASAEDQGQSSQTTSNPPTDHQEFTRKWSEEKKRRLHIRTCPKNPRVKYQNNSSIEIKIPCRQCDKTFVTARALEQHIASLHEKIFKFYCEICARGFQTSCHLQRHIDFVHTTEKKFQCDLCQMRFKYSHQLLYHRRKHTGEIPYICEVCGKGFHVAQKLRLHATVHLEVKACPCRICGKLFKSERYAKNHISTTHFGSRKNRYKKSSETLIPSESEPPLIIPPEYPQTLHSDPDTYLAS